MYFNKNKRVNLTKFHRKGGKKEERKTLIKEEKKQNMFFSGLLVSGCPVKNNLHQFQTHKTKKKDKTPNTCKQCADELHVV